MYTAGDGFVNPLGWSIAHIACKYGDVMVLELTHPGSRLEKKLHVRPCRHGCLMEHQWTFS